MLSVLLPVRDGAATLEAALASLEAQTLAPERIVVVDDGSVDGTTDLLDRWLQRCGTLTVLHSGGVGIARALNKGLEHALAEGAQWIARMDADDLCHPTRLEKQREHGEKNRLSLVGCEVAHVGDEEFPGMREHVRWANGIHSHEALALALWVDSPLPHPGWLVHRDGWEKVGAYDDSGAPEDYHWLHRFFAAARADERLRAGKPSGPLLDWTDSAARLTRTGAAYTEAAFGAVKAEFLARWLSDRKIPPRLFFVGLGRRGKGIFPLLQSRLGNFEGIVDLHRGRVGMRYRGVPVWGPAQWEEKDGSGERLVVASLGTDEARRKAREYFAARGLVEGRGFLAI